MTRKTHYLDGCVSNRSFASGCTVVWLCSHVIAVSECKEFFFSSDLYLGLNFLGRRSLAEATAGEKERRRDHCVL